MIVIQVTGPRGRRVAVDLTTVKPAPELFHDDAFGGLGERDMAWVAEPLRKKRKRGAA
jgi:hypothetical protein